MVFHLASRFTTELGYLYGSFDGSNDGKLVGLLIIRSLVSTYGKVIGSNEGIKLVSTGVKVIGNILENVDGITLGIDVGIDLGSLYGSLDGSNYGKLHELLLLGSLGSIDGKLPGSYEGIKMGYNDVKVIGTILVNVDGITLGIYFGTELDSLYG